MGNPTTVSELKTPHLNKKINGQEAQQIDINKELMGLGMKSISPHVVCLTFPVVSLMKYIPKILKGI